VPNGPDMLFLLSLHLISTSSLCKQQAALFIPT
jgi:hypothetical protein